MCGLVLVGGGGGHGEGVRNQIILCDGSYAECMMALTMVIKL